MTRTDQSWSINNETDLRFYSQNADTETPSNILHSMNGGGTFVWNNGSGSEQMRLTSTGLGIGTSSPTAKLDVNGGTNSEMRLTTSGSGYLQVGQFNNGAFIGTSSTDATAGILRLGTGGSERMRLDSSGNLGIGTSSPSNKLHVTVSAASTAVAAFYNTDAADGTGVYIKAGGSNSGKYALAIDNAASSSLLFLDSSGNLGLGVTPSAWNSSAKVLQLNSDVALWSFAGTNAYLSVNRLFDTGSTNRYISNGFATAYEQDRNTGQHIWFNAPSGTAGNAISFTQAMTLDASGNLGIGTSSPSSITAGYTTLDIRGSSGGGIRTGKSAAENGLWYTDASQGWFGTVSNIPQVFYTNNTERARIPAAGGMVVGTAALATTATDGFLYVPTCAGTPTGTPTTQTGTAPIVVDTTNNKLYFYSGGQWRDAGP